MSRGELLVDAVRDTLKGIWDVFLWTQKWMVVVVAHIAITEWVRIWKEKVDWTKFTWCKVKDHNTKKYYVQGSTWWK